MIGIICGTLLNKKTPDETPEKEEVKEEVKTLTTEEILSSLVGEWGMCYGYYDCRGILISKRDDGKYNFTPYVMWSEFGSNGIVENSELLEENKYKLTIHYPAYENELGSSPEKTGEFTIDITDVSNNVLYFGEEKYQKITVDRETFFKSIM